MIYLATDHTGLDLKNAVKDFLVEKSYEVEDLGAYELDPGDDFPDFISKAGEKVSKNPQDVAIIFGGSGQGEAMLANKYPNVRCALFYSQAVPAQAADISGRQSSDPFEIVKLTRQHNHANILSIGARFLKEEDVLKAVLIWLETPFGDEQRHVRRVEKIKKIEESL